MTRVYAPFSLDQIEALNAFQKLGYFHPFTCGNRNDHVSNSTLVASEKGWSCPHRECGYTQDWAFEFMADKNLHPKMPKILEGR
jgi:hypothetical protein